MTVNPTVRYLAKETALRWRTRPSSPLARVVLTFTLTATAGGFLAGFAASADTLRAQLARFGFNTLVVRSATTASATPALAPRPTDHWAGPLANDGRLTVLQQSPALATSPWGQRVTVFTTGWPVVAQLLHKSEGGLPAGAAESSSSSAAVWLTRDWPPGRTTTFQLDHGGPLVATACVPEGPWHALIEGDALIVPAEVAPAGARGGVDVVLFTPDDPTTLPGWVDAVRRMFAADGGPAPVLQDPGPLRSALAGLEHRQNLWRSVVLALLGAGVLLIFVAIAVLEQREVRFSQALLRSLGVRRRLLWTASLGENLILANAALAVALVAVHTGARALLSQLPVLEGATEARLPAGASLFLLAVVNAGVVASLVPLARALRQPIGTQLA